MFPAEDETADCLLQMTEELFDIFSITIPGYESSSWKQLWPSDPSVVQVQVHFMFGSVTQTGNEHWWRVDDERG